MNYKEYSAGELATDPWFRKWVKEADAESQQFWNDWIKANPEKKIIVEEARELVLLLTIQPIIPTQGKAEALWEGIQAAQTDRPSIIFNQQPYRSFISIAVAIALLMVSVWGGYYILSHQSSETFIETAYGENKSISLPDGSVVMLNANSQLSYHENWDQKDVREVWLEGEAFFEVKKVNIIEAADPTSSDDAITKKVKFIVHSQDILIEVLGTEFSVNNRREETKVVLQSGEVRVKKEKEQSEDMVMLPGEMITYSKRSEQLTKTRVDPVVQTSWKDELLIFNQEPVGDIIARIEDTYGIHVQCENEAILDRKYTGSIPTDSVEQFFTKISKLYDLKITSKDNHILIR